jgi:hypothetical protein
LAASTISNGLGLQPSLLTFETGPKAPALPFAGNAALKSVAQYGNIAAAVHNAGLGIFFDQFQIAFASCPDR